MSYLKAGTSLHRRNNMEKSLKSVNLVIAMMLVTVFTFAVSNFKLNTLRTAYYAKTESADSVEKNLKCLALNIYREAGHEPFEGKVGVAQVVMNRTKNPDFPNTVCDVVYQKNTITGKIVCQFSWYCDSTIKLLPVDKEAYQESYRVAKMVMVENFELEILKTALYYHADYINPNWKLKKITKIGAHIFYS